MKDLKDMGDVRDVADVKELKYVKETNNIELKQIDEIYENWRPYDLFKPGDNNTELLAFVSIPEDKKATHVDVYADDNLAFSVYELNIHETVGDLSAASKGTGTCNTTLDITDVNATATNYLLIQVVTVNKTDRIWGAKVTIASQ